jgi:hypothetical protein
MPTRLAKIVHIHKVLSVRGAIPPILAHARAIWDAVINEHIGTPTTAARLVSPYHN